MLFTTIDLNAFTTTVKNNSTVRQVELPASLFSKNSSTLSYIHPKNLKLNELQISTTQSADLITNNLTLLYSMCVALVLFNLIAQIKIIVQMIHLFFQFRKKDEFVSFNSW